MLDEPVTFGCPYCGETLEIPFDRTAGKSQNFVYDCEVCCKPISVSLTFDEDGIASVDAVQEP